MSSRFPIPHLVSDNLSGIRLLTDRGLFQKTGVRLAFTGRDGGSSSGPYASLNLGMHDLADQVSVERNREDLLFALGAQDARLLVPNQVHGTDLVHLDSVEDAHWTQCCEQVASGADGVIVSCANAAVLLYFADCMPVVLVAPGGQFAVVHAGWRGVYNRIVPKALGMLCEQAGAAPDECNIYIGPYIHAECFEVADDLAEKFSNSFGNDCIASPRHVDMGQAIRTSLLVMGADPARIADAGICTACNNDLFFSYRAQGGICGRHGAIAVRIES